MLDLCASGGIIPEFASFIPQLRRIVLLQIDDWRFLFIGGRVVGRRAAEDLRRILQDRRARSAKFWSADSVEEMLELGPPVGEMLMQLKKFAAVQVEGRTFLSIWGRIVGESDYDDWMRIIQSDDELTFTIRRANEIEDLVELGPTVNELLLRACGDLDQVG